MIPEAIADNAKKSLFPFTLCQKELPDQKGRNTQYQTDRSLLVFFMELDTPDALLVYRAKNGGTDGSNDQDTDVGLV